jgi:hypothetical protein
VLLVGYPGEIRERARRRGHPYPSDEQQIRVIHAQVAIHDPSADHLVEPPGNGPLHGVTRGRLVKAAVDPRRAEVRRGESRAEEPRERTCPQLTRLDRVSGDVCVSQLDEMTVQPSCGQLRRGEPIACEVQEG